MPKRQTKQMSIKSQMRIYSLLLAGVACVVILTCAATTMNLIHCTDRFFAGSDLLSTFYTHTTAMNTHARNFVWLNDMDEYEAYFNNFKQAHLALSKIEMALNSEMAWRMSLLGNMLDSYNEQLDAFRSGGQNWFLMYQSLNYSSELIQKTATQYRELLVTDMRTQMAGVRTLWVLQFCLSGVLMVGLLSLGVYLSRYYSRKISQPFAKMVENIYSIKQGDYEIERIEDGPVEMEILTTAFYEMAGDIKNTFALMKYNAQLDRELLERENENLAMKNRLFETELKNLQAQINPHFLFNTLNMLSKRSLLGGDEIGSQLMDSISALLRYGLDKSNKISTLKEELDCIENYFSIQQQRFDGRISFCLEVEQNLPPLAMPAMVLQPIVENSIIHGMRDITENADIMLKVHRFNGKVHIHIEDNGGGIASNALEQLMASLHESIDASPTDSGHIGLENVYKRLMMYYGPEMRFVLESEPGCGTIVTLEIPLEAGEKL